MQTRGGRRTLWACCEYATRTRSHEVRRYARQRGPDRDGQVSEGALPSIPCSQFCSPGDRSWCLSCCSRWPLWSSRRGPRRGTSLMRLARGRRGSRSRPSAACARCQPHERRRRRTASTPGDPRGTKEDSRSCGASWTPSRSGCRARGRGWLRAFRQHFAQPLLVLCPQFALGIELLLERGLRVRLHRHVSLLGERANGVNRASHPIDVGLWIDAADFLQPAARSAASFPRPAQRRVPVHVLRIEEGARAEQQVDCRLRPEGRGPA